jgi:hypothetical protein
MKTKNKNNGGIAKGKAPNQGGPSGAKKELAFQQGIERMQLAMKKGLYDLVAVVAKAEKERQRISKLANDLIKVGLKPLSDYTVLRDIYNNDLSQMTEESFSRDADFEVQRFMAKAQGAKVTESQEKVIINFYHQKAKSNFQVINNIHNILVDKGMIKGKIENVLVDQARHGGRVKEDAHNNNQNAA